MNPNLTTEQRTRHLISLTTGQYQLLYNLITDAYDRGYHRGQFRYPSIDTQTFDDLFDAIFDAKETYLA